MFCLENFTSRSMSLFHFISNKPIFFARISQISKSSHATGTQSVFGRNILNTQARSSPINPPRLYRLRSDELHWCFYQGLCEQCSSDIKGGSKSVRPSPIKGGSKTVSVRGFVRGPCGPSGRLGATVLRPFQPRDIPAPQLCTSAIGNPVP